MPAGYCLWQCNLSQMKRNNSLLLGGGGVEVSGGSKSQGGRSLGGVEVSGEWKCQGGRNHANRECTPRLPYYRPCSLVCFFYQYFVMCLPSY